MLEKILSVFGVGNAGTSVGTSTKRKYPRHQGFEADVLIDGKKFRVNDWSLGGVAFHTGGDLSIKKDDKIEVIIQFRFSNNNIAISQRAHVLRHDGFNCAAEFEPLPQAVKQEFDRILETLYAQSFVDSQTSI